MNTSFPRKFNLGLFFLYEPVNIETFSLRNESTKEMLEFGPLKHCPSIWILRRFFEDERTEVEQVIGLNHDGTLSDNDDNDGNYCNIVFTQWRLQIAE